MKQADATPREDRTLTSNRLPKNPLSAVLHRVDATSRIAKLFSLLLVLFTVVLASNPASAHTGVKSYIYLDVTESSLSGRIEAPIPDLRDTLDLGLEGSDEQIIDEINNELDAISSYFSEHFIFEVDGETLPITYDEASLFFSEAEEADDNYVIFPFEVQAGETVAREFDLQADFFIEEIDGRENWLIIGNDWQAGVIENGYQEISRFTEPDATESIDLGEPNRFQNFLSSVKLGVNHIQTGPDHILFVLVLLLPSVLVFNGSWKPSASFGSALWRVLKIATMFTVAHSITFTLAGLDILPLPSSRIVESIIALSIGAAALHNLRPVAANREWLISFVFGLFHGMGFASLISGLDISRSTQLVSLLGRNVGIEIGQSVVILLLFPALFVLRRTTLYRPFFVAGSLLLAFVSFGWMIERLFEVDLGMSTIIDPVFAWPRVLLWVAALSLIAIAAWKKGDQDDALLPVVKTATDQPVAANT